MKTITIRTVGKSLIAEAKDNAGPVKAIALSMMKRFKLPVSEMDVTTHEDSITVSVQPSDIQLNRKDMQVLLAEKSFIGVHGSLTNEFVDFTFTTK